jgi:hypothetical protein
MAGMAGQMSRAGAVVWGGVHDARHAAGWFLAGSVSVLWLRLACAGRDGMVPGWDCARPEQALWLSPRRRVYMPRLSAGGGRGRKTGPMRGGGCI